MPISDKISDRAKKLYVFDYFQTGSLVFLGNLCDNDCIAIFTKYGIRIFFNNKIIIVGKRTNNRLWKVPVSNDLPSQNSDKAQKNTADTIMTRNQTNPDLT